MINFLPKLMRGFRLRRQKFSRYARVTRLFMLVSVGLILLLGLGAPLAARAATNTVTNLNDSGPGSLRQAIADATPGDTINFAVSGTIILTSGELVVNKDLSLIGSGAANISISGNTVSRVINNSANLTINGITIRNGEVGVGSGGGILNTGTGVLTITNSVITANRAQKGGGIFNSAGGQLQVTNTTISANFTRLLDVGLDASGAGVYNLGVVSISNSTISLNDVHDHGSGLYNDGTATVANSTFTEGQANTASVYNEKNGSLQLNNVTITLNSGRKDATGLLSNGGTVSVANSIISNNHTVGGGNNNSLPDCGGKLTSGGHNLIGNATGCNISAGTGDLLGTNNVPIDAKLGALQNNGGATSTHALLSGSPAIDAGSPAVVGSGSGACEATDQRGVVRPVQGLTSLTCDIGAVEIGANPAPTNTATSVPPSPTSIPASPTSIPASPTSIPASPTSIPASPTSIPASPTSIPASPTNVPASPTNVPASPTNVPASPTSIPASPTNTPVNTPTNTPTPPANTPGKVEGGGVIKASRGRVTFGFEVEYSKGAHPFGHLTFKDHGANNLSLKATSFTLLNISGQHAIITGFATVNGQANVAFTLDVYDFGRHGSSDKFMIQIPAFGYSAGGVLKEGNIKIEMRHRHDDDDKHDDHHDHDGGHDRR